MIETIFNHNLFWNLPADRLPPNLSEFACEFVMEECATSTQNFTRSYLRFFHPQDNIAFQIMIDELNPPSSCIYEAEIDTTDLEEPKIAIKDEVNAICFTTVKNYQRAIPKFKEIVFNEEQAFPSDDEICPYLQLQDQDNEYNSDDEQSLIDFSPDNEKFVKHEVLMFLKNKANRFKKMKEIKAHLRKLKYNVPDNHLKTIISGYCGSHIMDKKKGFLVHEEYLSQEQKRCRQMEQEEQEKKEREKQLKKIQKKKGGKKEGKERMGKKKITITNEELLTYAKTEKNPQSIELLLKKSKKK